MKAICVYCGSRVGNKAEYVDAAKELARKLVAADVTVIYGGGDIGLMGVLADEVIAQKGRIIGVIPQGLLDREVAHADLTELHVVSDMHERKAMMADFADGFIAMAGGLGTLEELFEILTWAQLKIHEKPVALLNVAGFYDGLLTFLRHQIEQGFVSPKDVDRMVVGETVDDVLKGILPA